jgi:hypothetical protein
LGEINGMTSEPTTYHRHRFLSEIIG